MRFVAYAAASAVLCSCHGDAAPALQRDAGRDVSGGCLPTTPVGRLNLVEVVRALPHARDAFTEGLAYYHPWLYESTGLSGHSSLRRIDPESGVIAAQRALDADEFGEGLAIVDDTLIQLSWRSGRAFVWDRERFELLREFSYDEEGWGLCFDGEQLVMSDGSSTLQFRDPVTFEMRGRVDVRRFGEPVEQLNELECVRNEVYANVLGQRRIARICAETGEVSAWIDTGDLLSQIDNSDAAEAGALNGIAYVTERDTWLLTGKQWPNVFEVRISAR
jgi:glutamine cyclotransferase